MTIAELVGKFLRSERDPEIAVKAVERNSKVYAVDTAIARRAGELHAEARKKQPNFGLADAFVLATSRRISSSCKIITGDPHFKNIPEAILL